MKTLHLSIIISTLSLLLISNHLFNVDARCLTDVHGNVIGGCYAPPVYPQLLPPPYPNTTNLTMNYNSTSPALQIPVYQVPLMQFKQGTPAFDVKCNDGLQLILKAEDGSPACVTSNTAQKLMERGWATVVSNTSGNSTLPTSFLPCDTSYPLNNDGFPVNEKGIPLLYMPLNSVGKICVNYYDILHSGDVRLRIYNMTTLSSIAPEITISASQNTISNGTGNATVIYTIKTGNYSGLYGWDAFCVPLPFAVGYDNASKITRADLTWNPEGTYFCPAGFYDFNVIGLSGIGFTMIP